MSKLEKALNEYFAHFGENYPLVITYTITDDEVIEDISRCIETNTKAKKPEYEDGVDY